MDKGYIGCEGVVFSTGTCWMLWSEWRSWRGGDLFHDVPDIPRSVQIYYGGRNLVCWSKWNLTCC